MSESAAVIALLSLTLLACSSDSGESNTTGDTAASDSHMPDSTAAIRLAEAAFRHPVEVTGFERMDCAYLIQFLPVEPADERIVVVGGGGLVLVTRGGHVRVIERYR